MDHESFPGRAFIPEPDIDRRFEIEIRAKPAEVWPWIKQMGYHRAGWYVDTWWDRLLQRYFWPNVVPREARGTYESPAARILPEYQNVVLGDVIPDGPPGSAYYEVVGIEEDRLLLLFATSHFKYMAPQWVYRTRWAPHGAFAWAFILSDVSPDRCRLTTWWRARVHSKLVLTVLRPLLALVDGAYQRQILQGIKRRVEAA